MNSLPLKCSLSMSNLFNCQDIQRDVFHQILATFVKAISPANHFLKDVLTLETSLFLSCFLFSLPLYFSPESLRYSLMTNSGTTACTNTWARTAERAGTHSEAVNKDDGQTDTQSPLYSRKTESN